MSNEKKGKELKLDNFKITGDIIKWNGSVIKIANISYVTNDKFELPAFPKLSVVLILFGLLLRSFNTAAFAGCVAAGIAWILYWYFEKEDLKEYFAEFRKYEPYCRFQGCMHLSEPDCGVKEALAEGKISSIRYESYKELYEELKQKRRY